MQEGAEGEQGQESAPQRQAAGFDSPTPPGGLVELAELPSSPCSEPGAASSWGPGARQPPARAPALLAFPGGGVSYKDSCGSLERGARGRFSSESSPRARPASGPDRAMSRGAVCHHLVF